MIPIHALLIGIDHYPEAKPPHPTLFGHLGGCVRDVLEVDRFLRERLGVPESQITRLLSPLPGNDGRGALQPTYHNIVAAWQQLIDQVPPGAQIYIHYAGHGGRVKTCVPDIKGRAARDEVLAPCDVNDRASGRYLRDVEIASLLAEMTGRHQLATIVVDACHSGGIHRDGAVVRGGIADDVDPRSSDALGSAVASQAELEAIARGGAATRGLASASMVGASTTVVVAACRQNELAYEVAFDRKVRRGALTFFWLQALDRRTGSLTYRAAERQIGAAIAAHLPGQTPVVIGDGEREVLGLDHVRPARAIAVHAVDGPRVALRAGMASLIRRGMRLAIAPPDAVAERIEIAGLPEVEVIEVGAASSIARRVGDSAGAIVAGAQAIPLRFTDSITRFASWRPSELADDEDARRAFTAALAADRSKLLGPAGDGAAADYLVALTTDGGAPAYRIEDGRAVPVPRLGPPIGVAEAGAAARVVARLAHLARFRAVYDLDNSDPRSPLTGRLELELLALQDDFEPGGAIAPRPFPAGRPASIVDGNWFCLRLRNRSPFELCTVILDLQPDWGISKAVPTDMPWLQLEPGGFVDTVIRGWLPAGHDAASDTLKAIASVEPTAFDWLCLDPLERAATLGTTRSLPGAELHSALESMQRWTTVQRTITVEARERVRDRGAT